MLPTAPTAQELRVRARAPQDIAPPSRIVLRPAPHSSVTEAPAPPRRRSDRTPRPHALDQFLDPSCRGAQTMAAKRQLLASLHGDPAALWNRLADFTLREPTAAQQRALTASLAATLPAASPADAQAWTASPAATLRTLRHSLQHGGVSGRRAGDATGRAPSSNRFAQPRGRAAVTEEHTAAPVREPAALCLRAAVGRRVQE